MKQENRLVAIMEMLDTTKAYSEPRHTSKMEHFAKIIDD